MADNEVILGKILAFLGGEFARQEGRQCTQVDLVYAPGEGFKDDEIRRWVRTEEPELFDNFANIEKLASTILDIAENEADTKPRGKHRFFVRTHQALGGRAKESFALMPAYHGEGESALAVPGTGGGRGGGGSGDASSLLMNHAGQLLRVNVGMYDSTIRVLAQQNNTIMQQNMELHSENIQLRREIDEARSNKDARDFEYAMAAEKNARTSEGFKKLMQIGSVVAARIAAPAEQGASTSTATSPLAMLVADFGKSLRRDQMEVLMNTLETPQKMMFMEIMKHIGPPPPPEPEPPRPRPSATPAGPSEAGPVPPQFRINGMRGPSST